MQIGINPAYSKKYPLKIEGSPIPQALQKLITKNRKDKLEARNQELEELFIKWKDFIESSEKEVADLKKEILRRKLAVAKSQKIVTENYLPHLPKRRRWNPFNR